MNESIVGLAEVLAGWSLFVAIALALTGRFRQRRLLRRMREFRKLRDDIVDHRDAEPDRQQDEALLEFRMRIVSLERRLADLRRDVDLGGQLQQRLYEKPVLTIIGGLMLVGAAVSAAGGSLLADFFRAHF